MSARFALVLALAFAFALPRFAAAQRLPPAPRAAHVAIVRAPALELAHDGIAILRWTATNPGGLDTHLGVVHYGTDPAHLDRVAQSPIRLDRGHATTLFRVRVSGLRAGTTYFYSVTSTDSAGTAAGVHSAVDRFTMPGAGERYSAARATRP